MASDHIEMTGTISAIKGGGFFTVAISDDHSITARPSGRISKANITIVAGDTVTVEVSPYDLTKGRITYRHQTRR